MSRRPTATDELTELLVEHTFDGEMYPPSGHVWVSCSCSRTDMYGGADPWPVVPIKPVDAYALHAAHQAEVIADWLAARDAARQRAEDVKDRVPDFDPGDPVRVLPDAAGSNVVNADDGWEFAGPTRHPRVAVIRDVHFNSTVHVDRVRLTDR